MYKRQLLATTKKKITQQRSTLETLSAGEESSVQFISIIQRVLGRLIAAGRATPIPAKSPGHPIFQVYILRGIYAPQVGDQSETWTCGLAKPAREDGLSIKNLKKVKIAKPAHFYRPGFNRSGPRSHTFSLKRRNFWLSPALSVPTRLPPRFPQRRRSRRAPSSASSPVGPS